MTMKMKIKILTPAMGLKVQCMVAVNMFNEIDVKLDHAGSWYLTSNSFSYCNLTTVSQFHIYAVLSCKLSTS